MNQIFITFLLLICWTTGLAQGQAPGQGSDRGSRTGGRGSALDIESDIEDTVKLRYITLEDINKDHLVVDTLFDDFEKYATARQFRTRSLTLGNLGSSAQRMMYQPRTSIFKDAGFHQYDNYKLNLNAFRYYKLGEAYSDLFFSPVAGRENFLVKAKFSGNFDNDVNLSIDLKRISQEGFYQSQTTKSTSFGIGFWKQNPEKNHQLFLSIIANNHNEDHNGGVRPVTTPSVIRDRDTEGVYLGGADTRHQHIQYALDNFFEVKNGRYKAHHQVKVENGYYRFSDAVVTTTNDSIVYPEAFINERGIRYYLGFFKLKNTIDLSFDAKKVGLTLGLSHLYSRFNADIETLNFNDLIAFANLNVSLGQVAQLTSRGELGIGQNTGNLKLTSQLKLEPIPGLQLTGNLNISRYDPSVIHEHVDITFTNVISNEFSKINEFSIGGQLFWDKIKTGIEFNSGLIDNPIAYDFLAMPYQKAGSTEYIQAIAYQKWKYKSIGLENSVVYQTFTDNLYVLPTFYGIHNLFVEFPLFKNQLQVRLGGLYYSLSQDESLSFFPITGNFIPTEAPVNLSNNPYYEFYSDFKIGAAMIYLKLENANDLFIPQEYYEIANYPQFDWKLRLGAKIIIRG